MSVALIPGCIVLSTVQFMFYLRPCHLNPDQSSSFGLFLNGQPLSNAPRFFALDLEGRLSRKPPVVKQSAAVDIDLTDSEDDQIMSNVNIHNPRVVKGEKDSQEAETEDLDLNLLKFVTSDYWQYNRETLSGERVDAVQAAAITKESGITCHDYIILWHKHRADVCALRLLLSQTCIQGIMPPDDYIIRLPYLFRHSLDFPRSVTSALEFLFSVSFPTDPLLFSHHDASIDSKEAALTTLLAEKLCNGESTAEIMGLGFRRLPHKPH
ncbi:hypothetical protein DL769_005455 [Monosporascus sp. CRB-8-3]|nr:hypothetical protein DL769_005455 [Monosporascus sp. CRB-8-3]